MPHRKTRDKLNGYHLDKIDRQISLLRIVLTEAQMSLAPFRAHYDAISALHDHLQAALNLLNDRPADHREPHRAPMSAG